MACGFAGGLSAPGPPSAAKIQGWSRGSDFVLQTNVLAGDEPSMAVATAPIDAMGKLASPCRGRPR